MTEFEDTDRRYRDAFGEGLPIATWFGPREQFLELCEKAIAKGEPLTERDLYVAQGGNLDDLPPDALL